MSEIDSRLEGWEVWEGVDPFEDHCGPMYYRKVDGKSSCQILLDDKHMNSSGNVHGGVLMTFADYALYVLSRAPLAGQTSVTVSFNCEFIGPAVKGDMLEATGEILRETGRMLFMRGLISCGDSTVLSYSALLRKVKRR
ncbi:MAG TPA: PaaI family thioesterase [Candidatus Hydrogenedentes bacterium]|nr:PaaI family thioesterase [Candidatus Hydrogenedentota bacterium]